MTLQFLILSHTQKDNNILNDCMVVLKIGVLQILMEELGIRELTSKFTCSATVISSPL